MSNTSSQSSSWSKRRLWWTAVVIFFVQLTLVFVFGERQITGSSAQRKNPPFSFITSQVGESEIFQRVFASDPTLFVLPNRHGFSGAAWLASKPIDYQPPHWDEPAQWLAPDVRLLGRTFLEFVQTNRSAPVQIAAEPIDFKSEEPSSPLMAARPSALRIEGDLARRKQTGLPKLPVWRHTEPVSDSVVQVAVDGAGEVVSLRLLSPRTTDPGALPAANQKALEIARELRFTPVNSAAATNLTWGKLIFEWETQPVVTTNGVNSTATTGR